MESPPPETVSLAPAPLSPPLALLVRVQRGTGDGVQTYCLLASPNTKPRDLPLPDAPSLAETLSLYLLTPRERVFERLLSWERALDEQGVVSGATLLVHDASSLVPRQERLEPLVSDVETTSPPSRVAPGSTEVTQMDLGQTMQSGDLSPVSTPISHIGERKGVFSLLSASIRARVGGASSPLDLLRRHEDTEGGRSAFSTRPASPLAQQSPESPTGARFGRFILGVGGRACGAVDFDGDGGAVGAALGEREIAIVESVLVHCSSPDPVLPFLQHHPHHPGEAETDSPLLPLRLTLVRDFVGAFCLLISKDKSRGSRPQSILLAALPLLQRGGVKVVEEGEREEKGHLTVDDLTISVSGDKETLQELGDGLTFAYSSMYSGHSTQRNAPHSSLHGLHTLRMRLASVELGRSLCQWKGSKKEGEGKVLDCPVIARERLARLFKTTAESPHLVPSLSTLLQDIKEGCNTNTQVKDSLRSAEDVTGSRRRKEALVVLRYTYLLDREKRGEVVNALCSELSNLTNHKTTPTLDREAVDGVLCTLNGFLNCPGPTGAQDSIPTLCETFMDMYSRLIDTRRYFQGTDKEQEFLDLLGEVEVTRKALKVFLRELPQWSGPSPGRLHMEAVPLDNGVSVCSGSGGLGVGKEGRGFGSGVFCSVLVMDEKGEKLLVDSSTGFLPTVNTGCSRTDQCILYAPSMLHWVRTGLGLELEMLNRKGEYVSAVERTLASEQGVRRRVLDAMQLASGIVAGVKSLDIFPDTIQLTSLDGKPVHFVVGVSVVKELAEFAAINPKLEVMTVDTFVEREGRLFSIPNVPLFSLRPDTSSVTFPLYIRDCLTSPFSEIAHPRRREGDTTDRGSTRLLLFNIDGEDILLCNGSIPNCEFLDHRITQHEFKLLIESLDSFDTPLDSPETSLDVEGGVGEEGRDEDTTIEPHPKISQLALTKLRELLDTLGLDIADPKFDLFRLSPILLDERGETFGVCVILGNRLTEKNFAGDTHKFRTASCTEYMEYLAQRNSPIRYSQFVVAQKEESRGCDPVENALLWGNDVAAYASSDTLSTFQLMVAPHIKEAKYVKEYMTSRMTCVFLSRAMCVFGGLLSPGAVETLRGYFDASASQTSMGECLSLETGERFDGGVWDRAVALCKERQMPDPLKDGYDAMALEGGVATVIREGLDVNFAGLPKEVVNINEKCFNYLDYKVDLTDAYRSLRVDPASGAAGSERGGHRPRGHSHNNSKGEGRGERGAGTGKGFYRTHSRYTSSAGMIGGAGQGSQSQNSLMDILNTVLEEREREAGNPNLLLLSDGVDGREARADKGACAPYDGGYNRDIFDERDEMELDTDTRPYTGDIEVLSHREGEIEDITERCKRLLHDMCEVEQGERTMINETTAYFNNTLMRLEQGAHSGASTPRDKYKLDSSKNNDSKRRGLDGTRASLTSTRTLYYSNATRKTPAGTDFFRDGKPVVRLISSEMNSEEHKRSTMARTIGSPLSRSLYHTMKTKRIRGLGSLSPPSSHPSSSRHSKSLSPSSIRFIEIISGFNILRLPFTLISPRARRVEDLDIDFEGEQIIPEFNKGTLSLTCSAEVSTELLNSVAYCIDLEDGKQQEAVFDNQDILYSTFVLMILLGFPLKNLFVLLARAYDNGVLPMDKLDAILETLLNAIEDTDDRFLKMIHPTIISLPEDFLVRNLVFYTLLRYAMSRPHIDEYYTSSDFSDIIPLFRRFRNDMNISRIYSERLVRGLCCKMAEEEGKEGKGVPLNPQLLVAMSTLGLYVRNLDLTIFNFNVTRPENIIRFFPLVERVDLANTHISLSQLIHVLRPCTSLCEVRVTEFSINSCKRIMAELKVKVINN